MLNITLDREAGIAVLEPHGALEASDFENAARQIDPLIEELGKLHGLIIHVEKFPGWDSFAAFTTHMKFVKDHHQHIERVALVTDSPLGDVGEKLASHFVAAEIKHFAFSDLDQSKAWIAGT